MFKGVAGIARRTRSRDREHVQFAPEVIDRLDRIDPETLQMLLAFGEGYWRATGAQALPVSCGQVIAGVSQVKVKQVGIDCQLHAGCEPHQVVRVRQGPRLVEVVDPPDKTPFNVAPGAETVDVQIAHCKCLRRVLYGAGHVLCPQLDPSIKSTFEKCEKLLPHRGMLVTQVGFDHRDMLPHPGLVACS